MFKRFLCLSLSILSILTLAACNKNNDNQSSENDTKQADTQNITNYDFDDATVIIDRPKKENRSPLGEEGTWTILVYMCGSDLESKMGFASKDFQEMIDSSNNDKVHFVVETGGTSKWTNDISSDKIQRYEISNGKANLIEEQTYVAMGQSQTLADFIIWGCEKYPAGNMGLVLWDHGGGSISGVCFDEKAENDQLFLKEIDAALYNAYDKMTEPFEFIGFDACLMSNIEMAAILPTYSDYMVASEETEPGYGWDYKEIGKYLSDNPNADGKELGAIICDSFYDSCGKIGKSGAVTMSVIDLSRIDTVIKGFDLYAQKLYELTDDQTELTKLIRNINLDDKYGTNTRRTGYSNMADLGGIIKAGEDIWDKSTDLLSALDECVVYKKNGWQHSDACGLSIYYPFGINITIATELGILSDICISPYYLSFVAKIVYGAVYAALSEYDNSSLISQYSNNWSGGYSSDYTYQISSDAFEFANNYQASGQSAAITFTTEPTLESNGHYSFTLSESGLNNTDYVQSSVYLWLDGKRQLFELGDSGDITADYSSGKFTDNFNGKWFSLPDGQILSVYLGEKNEGADIYFTPIELNGIITFLRFSYNNATGKAEIIDVCDGVSDNGMSSRSYSLNSGDVIKPINFIHNAYTGKKNYSIGKAFTYSGESELTFAFLPKGEYWYSFRINDIYGNYYETEPLCFKIGNDTQQITFENETHRWISATCTEPKTCAFCGKTEGKAAGHKWQKATCEKPQTCSVCGKENGKASGHKWKEATFTEPKTCKVCGKTKGKAISTPIGSGYVDYTFIDVDNDGDKEYIELYERMVGQGPYVYYRIYDNQNDYYEIHGDAYGSVGHNYDYLAINKNTGELCVYTAYITHGQHESYKLGYYDKDENRIMVCEAERTTIDFKYYIPGKSYSSNENYVSKSEFESAINNVSLLYSYRDSSFSHFRDYNSLNVPSTPVQYDSNTTNGNSSGQNSTAYLDKTKYDIDNDGIEETIEVYDNGSRFRIYDGATTYKDVTASFGVPFIVYDKNRNKSYIYSNMTQNYGNSVFDENKNELLSIVYAKDNGMYVTESCSVNGQNVTLSKYLDYVNNLQIIYSYNGFISSERMMPPEYW